MHQENKSSRILTFVAIATILIGLFVMYMYSKNSSNDDEIAQQINQQIEDSKQNYEGESQDIVVLALSTDNLSTFVNAVQKAQLVETLQAVGPYTVLAPSNDAFAALPEGTLDSLLLPENIDQLSSILTYHVIAGNILSSDLSNGQVVNTVNGETLTVDITDAGVFFVDANGGRAQVTTADVEASNGTVHIINAVLLPS